MASKRPSRTLSTEEMEGVFSQFPDPSALTHLFGIARGEMPGDPGPLAGYDVGEIAQLERYADLRRMHPLAGLVAAGVLAPAWEAYKTATLIDPSTRKFDSLLAKAPPELSQFSTQGKGATSQPSLANLSAPFKGLATNIRRRMGGR